MKELVNNYKEAQIKLGDYIAKNIMNETYEAKINESSFIGYFAELECKIENVDFSITLANDFISYHERDGIRVQLSPEVEKEVINFAKSKLANRSKEEIISKIKKLEDKLKKIR